MAIQYDYIEEILPHDIFFITTQELEEMFPDNTPKEREYYITKTKGAVCIMKIGDTLENGEPHDGRAPDYDDWSLNADIVVYYPVLDIALEISSMGIRVDKKALLSQLKKAGCEERAKLPFQKAIINEELPYTIGGGIGQSRICMFFLRKAHIGEVQSSLWPEAIAKECEKNGHSAFVTGTGICSADILSSTLMPDKNRYVSNVSNELSLLPADKTYLFFFTFLFFQSCAVSTIFRSFQSRVISTIFRSFQSRLVLTISRFFLLL